MSKLFSRLVLEFLLICLPCRPRRSFAPRVLSLLPNPLAPAVNPVSIDPSPVQHNQPPESQRHHHQHNHHNGGAQMRLVHRGFFRLTIRAEYTSRPTVAATTNTTTTTCSVCVIRPP